ncbi:hypothetical protein MKX01_008588 [Papaver californicum]|nr:hypothetical protein MKX01_008588 [Papaver californicum]
MCMRMEFEALIINAYILNSVWGAEKWKPGRRSVADDSERGPLLSQKNKDGDSIKLQNFTFKELVSITNNFSEECKLDKDWFGHVYRGRLGSTGQVVAVKRLAKSSRHQENIDYVKELQRFSLINHPNLVNLFGYCDKGDDKFLVYELTMFGSLQEHLHDLSSKREPLDWNTRMKIAFGVAKGLEYLHHKAKPNAFHGYMESSNIFLDQGYYPKLALGGYQHIFRGRIMMAFPTFVYGAPKFALTGRLNSKSDIYSFGVVLLELITGKKVFDMTHRRKEHTLFQWARGLLQNPQKLTEMVDPLLQGHYPEQSLHNVFILAACMRPLISDIVTELSRLASKTYTPIPVLVQQIEVGPCTTKQPQAFTFGELTAATDNFKDESVLGEGGFGRVYKGYLESKRQVVAVKQLHKKFRLLRNREFLNEIRILSRLDHHHIINLVGFCTDRDRQLLVYEFMQLGSLKDHLYDLPPNQKPLDWNTRMNIAVGVAKGLEYLHDKVKPAVVHMDLKSSNILLDQCFHPKIGIGSDKTRISKGGERVEVNPPSYVYCAPEYGKTGQLTSKSDVYSFGVVLLELITGQKAVDKTRPLRYPNLVEWVRAQLYDRRNFLITVDPVLQGQYPKGKLQQALSIASMCLQEESTMRPRMRDVVTLLSLAADTCSAQKIENQMQLNYLH